MLKKHLKLKFRHFSVPTPPKLHTAASDELSAKNRLQRRALMEDWNKEERKKRYMELKMQGEVNEVEYLCLN